MQSVTSRSICFPDVQSYKAVLEHALEGMSWKMLWHWLRRAGGQSAPLPEMPMLIGKDSAPMQVQGSWQAGQRQPQQPSTVTAGRISATDKPQPKMQRMCGSIRKFHQVLS